MNWEPMQTAEGWHVSSGSKMLAWAGSKSRAEQLCSDHNEATRAAVIQEREECAKIADKIAWSHENTRFLGPELNCSKVAREIRGRS